MKPLGGDTYLDEAGGWAAGEAGLWQFREKDATTQFQQGKDKYDMKDAASIRGRSSPSTSYENRDAGEGEAMERAKANKAAELKFGLLKLVAGLDRGAAATAEDRNAVLEAADALAASAAPLSGAALESALEGTWRLTYSSTFAGQEGGTQGFTGTPAAGPVSLMAVYQRITKDSTCLENIVELQAGSPMLRGSASLAHDYTVQGNTTNITFTGVTVTPGGAAASLPAFTLPSLAQTIESALPDFLRPPGTDAAADTEGAPLALVSAGANPSLQTLQSGTFETPYVDEDLRISKGDRGELRVFVR